MSQRQLRTVHASSVFLHFLLVQYIINCLIILHSVQVVRDRPYKTTVNNVHLASEKREHENEEDVESEQETYYRLFKVGVSRLGR
jgi:hypothetical protein